MSGTNDKRRAFRLVVTKRDRRDGMRLRIAVRRHVIAHRNDLVVDPHGIASAVIEELTEQDRHVAAHLQLRHIARELLRREFEPDEDVQEEDGSEHSEDERRDEDEGENDKLRVWPPRRMPIRPRRTQAKLPEIPNLLQDRYPRLDHKGYVKRDEMVEDDWRWNVNRLLMEGHVKNEHAAELQRWGESKGWTMRAA